MEPKREKEEIRWHKNLDSTNSELRRTLEHLDNLSVTAAEYQTAGRGRGSHSWSSAPGDNLTFSVLLKFCTPDPEPGRLPALAAPDQELITDITTLSLLEFLREEGVEARIKWPNDIWVGDKKICGILVENILKGPWVASSIVGIGLNLNQRVFPENLPNPVSLTLLTGKKYDLRKTLAHYHRIYKEYALLMGSVQGRASLAQTFREHVFLLDPARQEELDAAIERFESARLDAQ